MTLSITEVHPFSSEDRVRIAAQAAFSLSSASHHAASALAARLNVLSGQRISYDALRGIVEAATAAAAENGAPRALMFVADETDVRSAGFSVFATVETMDGLKYMHDLVSGELLEGRLVDVGLVASMIRKAGEGRAAMAHHATLLSQCSEVAGRIAAASDALNAELKSISERVGVIALNALVVR